MSLFRRLYQVAKSQLRTSSDSPSMDEQRLMDELFENEVNDEQQAEAGPEPGSSEAARYYANLELPLGASYEEIKAAHKKLLRKYHPDFHLKNPEQAKIAEKISKGLNEAMSYFDKERKEGRL